LSERTVNHHKGPHQRSCSLRLIAKFAVFCKDKYTTGLNTTVYANIGSTVKNIHIGVDKGATRKFHRSVS